MAKGRSLNGYLEIKVARVPETLREVHESVDCMVIVEPMETMLEFRPPYDEKYPHRPYLHMVCGVKGIKARENELLPGGQKVIELPDDDQVELDAFYEFSNDEICELVKKGLYQRGFQAPQMFSEIMMNVPSPKTDLVLINNGKQTGYYVRIEDRPIHFSKETMENSRPLSSVFEKQTQLTDIPELESEKPEETITVQQASPETAAADEMQAVNSEEKKEEVQNDILPQKEPEQFAGFMAMTEQAAKPEPVFATPEDPYSQYRISEEEMMAEFLGTPRTNLKAKDRTRSLQKAESVSQTSESPAGEEKRSDVQDEDADRKWNRLTKAQKAALIAGARELESKAASSDLSYSKPQDDYDYEDDHAFDFMK